MISLSLFGSYTSEFYHSFDQKKSEQWPSLLEIGEKALEELSKVSCVIAPSKWEAFGLVLVESLALGIPIIASNIPAFHEILESGKQGILISEKNPQKYAAAVLQGVSPPSPSLEKFSWERCFSKYMAIFSDLKRSND